ncbi:MAG: zf-HC2 domain-containing protein [Corynebacterium sp.]|nr:zf-HC2 domain-containing protein [Corynebacterium sp.]
MECEEIRAALSARLDGEQASIADEVIDAHLGACEECRAWYERAVRLNRALTVGPADGMPEISTDDLSERILVSIEPERRRRERAWLLMAGTARGVLIALGLCWAVWGIATLVDASGMMTLGLSSAQPQDGAGIATSTGVPIDGSTATVDPMELGARLAIQLAAIRLALAVGLFWAAWRPRAAMGMAPVYGAVATFSIGFGIRDILIGAQGASEIAGLALMFVSALTLAVVWLGGYTPTAIAQAWRAASGLPVTGVPPQRD